MASVRKKTFTKSIPPDAEFFTRRGKEYARWKGRNGRTKTAIVTTIKDGSKRLSIESATYVARFRDGAGIIREVSTGCRDRDAAITVMNKLVSRSEKVKSGILTPTEDAIADHQRTPIGVHVAAYLTHLLAKGVSEHHHRNVKQQLERIVEECGFRRLLDLDGSTIEQWLTGLQVSARTRNTYLSNAISFANWCIRTKRIASNPFKGVAKADQHAGKTRTRRALTVDEFKRLLRAARIRPLLEAKTIRKGSNKGKQTASVKPEVCQRLEMLGMERALIYKTLALTGLRKSELSSITIGQLDLESPTSYISLHAADEKNRKGSEVPLNEDLSCDLREWVSRKLKVAQDAAKRELRAIPMRLSHGTQLFRIPKALTRVLDADLKWAGIDKTDLRGRTVDIHALRMTFGTWLSLNGVAPRTAQAAMRHSDIDLTMNVYTDPKLLDVTGAVNALPSLPLDGEREVTEQQATGTVDERRTLAPLLAPATGQRSISLTSTDKTNPCRVGTKDTSVMHVSVAADRTKAPLAPSVNNHPQGDSNPCLQDENLIS